jgi:hypothetical protein
MMFENIYDSSGEFTFKVKCNLCGEVLDSGIINIGNHTTTCPEMIVGLVDQIGGKYEMVKRKDVVNGLTDKCMTI